MSASRALTSLTGREAAEGLVEYEREDGFTPHRSAPTETYGAPPIDITSPWLDRYDRPAAWDAFGEPREDQQ